jgi:hypothetical protein
VEAFDMDSLAHVTIPDSVNFINVKMFKRTGEKNILPAVYIHNPNGKTTIERRAFGDESNSLKYKVYVMPASAYAWEQTNSQYTISQDFKWKKNEDGKSASVLEYSGKDTKINIPPQIWGFPVVELEKVARGDGSKKPAGVTHVTIPDSVTVIGERTFAYGSISSLVIGNCVKVIGKSAFRGNKLAEITIPESVSSMESYAFYQNQLTNITIPINITVISEYAFTENLLKKITLHDKITKIEQGAFSKNKFTAITIPDSVKSIGDYAFNLNNLQSLTIPDSVTVLGMAAFVSNSLKSIKIGKGISRIESHTFEENNLTEVEIPDNIEYIGAMAFSGENDANMIPRVVIPNHTKIERGTFRWDTKVFRKDGKEVIRK